MLKTSSLVLIALSGFAVATPIGAASGARNLELVLRLKPRVSMEELAQRVMDPRSPRYQRYYTPDEIRQTAGPKNAEYATLLSRLKALGFAIEKESKTHLFLTVLGNQPQIESVFSTELKVQSGADAAHPRLRALRKTKIPADLALIDSVIGLDSTRFSRSHLEIAPGAARLPTRARDGTISGLPPSYIQSAYGFTPIYQAGYKGKGQDIAIATYDSYFPDDITAYFAQWGISPAPLVDQVMFNGQPTSNDASAMETETDSEFAGMIAPGAMIHVFSSSHNDDAGEVQLFTAILDDNRAKIVNYSWGDCESNVSPQHFQDMNTVFARAVAQGVNILVASGDWGAAGCPVIAGSNDGPGGNTTLSADWPAANPYVVAVGGTTIVGGDNGNVQENGWDQSGGGVSSVFPKPSWESGFQSPFVKRAFPDVAFNADPNSGEPCYAHSGGSAQWIQIGGTSIAAPQWSGFLALVGQARGSEGTLGFLNPRIYALSSSQYADLFHDIFQGSNGGYTAGMGWDAVTGWGSLRAQSLLDFLRQP